MTKKSRKSDWLPTWQLEKSKLASEGDPKGSEIKASHPPCTILWYLGGSKITFYHCHRTSGQILILDKPQIILKAYPKLCIGYTYAKKYSLFIGNLNVTGYPIFLFAKSGSPIPTHYTTGICKAYMYGLNSSGLCGWGEWGDLLDVSRSKGHEGASQSMVSYYSEVVRSWS